MKIYIELQTSEYTDSRWGWTLESDNGRKLAFSTQVHMTKESCLKELKAIQNALAGTKIVERAPSRVEQLNISPPQIDDNPSEAWNSERFEEEHSDKE